MATPGTPPVPHVGGPILPPCAPTVLVGFMPQARVGDPAICVGPPDTISFGSMTVLAMNMMAARLGDVTVHGGVISIGFPQVIIGETASCFPGSVPPLTDMTYTLNPDGTATGTFGPRITVTGSPEFVQRTLANLAALSALASGQAVINAQARNVTITECGPGGDGANVASGNWANPALTNGTGVDATISHYPRDQVMYDGSESWMHASAPVILGHELSHSSRITGGTLNGDPTTGPTVPNDATTGLPMTRAREERQAVGTGADPNYGLPDNSGEPFSENTMRGDQGLPPRPRYTRNEW